MAKKKKNRRLNIVRKRAKRQKNQKSKRKQLAFQKQRALQTARSDEELLQDKIMNSKLLLDEPEFENITFDPDLLREKTMEALASDLFTLEYEEGEEPTPEDEEAPEHISDMFRFEVLPDLITVEFIGAVSHALKACEIRLRRMGYREKAEVALVARSLFEIADPEALAFHPLIFKICARTLEQTLAAPQPPLDVDDTIEGVFSDVLKVSQLEETDQEPLTDREAEEVGGEEEIVDSPSDPAALLEPEVELTTEAESVSPAPEILPASQQAEEGELDDEEVVDSPSDPLPEPEAEQMTEAELVEPAPEVSPEELRAKALYQNAHGLEIRNAIEAGNGYRVVEDTDLQIELVHADGQRYITLTADRLLLQCSSKEQLGVAMEEVEALCSDALFYLARMVDDG